MLVGQMSYQRRYYYIVSLVNCSWINPFADLFRNSWQMTQYNSNVVDMAFNISQVVTQDHGTQVPDANWPIVYWCIVEGVPLSPQRILPAPSGRFRFRFKTNEFWKKDNSIVRCHVLSDV